MTTIMSRKAAKYWWDVDLPLGVISLSRDHCESAWVEFTKKDLVNRKTRLQNHTLSYKRKSCKAIPCFIWVFLNKSFPFGGWHIYIKTAYEDYPLNFRNPKIELMEKAMSLFPCGILPIVFLAEKWMSCFAEEYSHIGFHRGLRGWKQGIAQCWCIIDEADHLTDIYSNTKTRLES